MLAARHGLHRGRSGAPAVVIDNDLPLGYTVTMNVVLDNEIGGDVLQAGESLRTIAQLLGELQQLNFACCDVNSATQCHILTTLAREGNQTLAALTRSLNLDKAWLSRTTDTMVEDGLLIKAPHPADRRALLLQLTAAGQRQAQALGKQLSEQAQRVLGRLPEAEQAPTLRLLEALKAALSAELYSGQGSAMRNTRPEACLP